MATASGLPREELARRLNLLMDVVQADNGEPYTYRVVAARLQEKGLTLSRARWSYMLSGERNDVKQQALLVGLAEIFEVPASYLLDADGEVPDRVNSQLEFVRSLRARRVRAFAARTLDDVSPETLKAITDYLNKDIGE
jgi:transcriptional regulator with XRE-family HTH domain